MEHGGVAIGYQAEDKGVTSSDGIYTYFYSNDEGNHEVVIVGWDDNFSKDKFVSGDTITENGAWIMRNSWGNWANSGYVYMSYAQPITDGAAFVVEDLPADLKIYQHDPLGWCDTYGENSRTLYAANAFKVRFTGEVLDGISFYTTEAGATVRWWIYDNGAAKPAEAPYVSNATMLAAGSETYRHAGYHTKKMTDNIPLTRGTYFTVVLEVTNPTENYPLAVERKMENRSDFAAVHDYESWFSENGAPGTWWDGVNTVNAGKSTPMNACIKAFTRHATGPEVTADTNTILGKSLVPYLVADSVNNVASSGDTRPNSNIPDEPLTGRLIYAASTLSGDPYVQGTVINYWLANVTEAHEFVEAYVSETDTRYPTGMAPDAKQRDYYPLFDDGCSPDVFWEARDGAEYPTYGPFVTSSDSEGYIYVDVNYLRYDSGDYGSVPKGYYDLVYTDPADEDGFIGSLELRLAATKQNQPQSDDVAPTSPDVITEYVSHDVYHEVTVVSREVEVVYVSRDVPVSHDTHMGVSSSSGGCDSGLGLAGLILLSGLAAAMKKR